MKIGVLIKTVQYVYAQTGMDLANNYVGPDDVVSLLNPLDEVALEYALRLKDQVAGASVAALSCGDAASDEGLRRALAMGADRAMRIHCDDRESLVPSAVAQLLAPVFKEQGFDLILCGAGALDHSDNLEAPFVAGHLDLPFASNIVGLSLGSDKKRLELQRVIERGDRQLLECRLPAVVTVAKGATTPRYPTLAGFLRARSFPITVLTPASLNGGNPSGCAFTGYTRPKPKKKPVVDRAELPPAKLRVDFMVDGDRSQSRSEGAIVDGASPEMLNRLDTLLKSTGVLKE